MKIPFKNFLFIFVVLLAMYLVFFLSPTTPPIQKYYSLLESNPTDKSLKPQTVEKAVDGLDNCFKIKKPEQSRDCVISFYRNYTVKNGPEKALAHMQTVLNVKANVRGVCHFMAHGVGEGAYLYFKENLADANNFPLYTYYKNNIGCGNGYFHGVALQFFKNVNTEDELVDKLKNYCKSIGFRKELPVLGCQHSTGHVIHIHSDYDLNKSINTCKLVYGNSNYFGCLGGVFMEDYNQKNYLGLLGKSVNSLENICSQFPVNSNERDACFFEMADIVNKKDDFIGASKECQKLDFASDRKACVKFNIEASISKRKGMMTYKMCDAFENKNEKMECYAYIANLFANILDSNRGDLFWQTLDESCKILPFFDYLKCYSMQLESQNLVQSNVDYGGYLNWNEIKLYFRNKFLNYRTGHFDYK